MVPQSEIFIFKCHNRVRFYIKMQIKPNGQLKQWGQEIVQHLNSYGLLVALSAHLYLIAAFYHSERNINHGFVNTDSWGWYSKIGTAKRKVILWLEVRMSINSEFQGHPKFQLVVKIRIQLEKALVHETALDRPILFIANCCKGSCALVASNKSSSRLSYKIDTTYVSRTIQYLPTFL